MPLYKMTCISLRARYGVNKLITVPSRVALSSSSFQRDNPLRAVLSSYSKRGDYKVNIPNLIDAFESKVDLMKYLNTNAGSIILAEKIRCDLQLYQTYIRNVKSTETSSVNANFVNNSNATSKITVIDIGLKDFLSTALCEDSLVIKELSFESTSGYTLEKIMRGEAVHAIKSIGGLKRRFREGRHCFALFHPSLPIDPLVFIHVALTDDISKSIVNMEYAPIPKCAVFYSVNSPYKGLGGLDLAGRLIKRTSEKLKSDYPSVQTFVTLSPLPGFSNWLKSLSYKMDRLQYLYINIPERLKDKLKNTEIQYNTTETTATLNSTNINTTSTSTSNDVSHTNTKALEADKDASVVISSSSSSVVVVDDVEKVLDLPSIKSMKWLISVLSSTRMMRNVELMKSLKDLILWLGCFYITQEQQHTSNKLPKDEVARFHLRNGASFHRLNWMANPDTESGLINSAGMMANYLYEVAPPDPSVMTRDSSVQSTASFIPTQQHQQEQAIDSSSTTVVSQRSGYQLPASLNPEDENIIYLRQYDLLSRVDIAKNNVFLIPVGSQVVNILKDKK